MTEKTCCSRAINTGMPLAIGVFTQVVERFAAQVRCVLAKFFFSSANECGCGSLDLPKVMSDFGTVTRIRLLA